MSTFSALTGRQQAALIDALLDAFRNRDEFEMLLALQLDESFDEIAGEGRLRLCVFRLVRTAMSGGWLPELVDAAVREQPRNAVLREWTESVGHVAVSPDSANSHNPPRPQRLTLTVYFDLGELRKAVSRAANEVTGRILAFGTTYPDGVYVGKLCDYLGSYLEPIQRKDNLSLLPEITRVSSPLDAVARYRRDLDSTNVLCVVYAEGAPPETVAKFWDGVRRTFDGTGRHLVLVLASHPTAVFPSGVVALPPPRFDVDDVDVWTHEVMRLQGWPAALASAWTELLRDEAADDEILDVRGLYEAMDRSLQEMQFAPEPFRRRLEERAGHGHATQA